MADGCKWLIILFLLLLIIIVCCCLLQPWLEKAIRAARLDHFDEWPIVEMVQELRAAPPILKRIGGLLIVVGLGAVLVSLLFGWLGAAAKENWGLATGMAVAIVIAIILLVVLYPVFFSP